MHSIKAWSKSNGLVLAQARSEGKKNENSSVLDMLDTLNISGAIVSADAMNTQKKIVSKILKNGGDYVLCVKNNHKKLKEEIAAYFHEVTRDTPKYIESHEEIDSGHGRIESRYYRQLRMSEWITEGNIWQGIQTLIEVTRKRSKHPWGKPFCYAELTS